MNSLARNDSSPMLRAKDLRTLQTAIFGRSSPDHTPRLSGRAKIVWLKRDPSYQPPLNCAPCYERECKFEHARGSRDVSPERAAAAVEAPIRA